MKFQPSRLDWERFLSDAVGPVGRFESTILFCDIRGFTALFDGREPGEAFQFVNSVLGELASVVEACHGTIDKFTGDGFLAHFGITPALPDHADAACWCAIRMRSTLISINQQRYFTHQPIVATGIGIHSGVVATGVISALRKTEATVLGTTVNLAARVEALTKYFGVDCLVSEDTVRALGHNFLLQTMPIVPLRGISRVVGTAWLLPMNKWEIT